MYKIWISIENHDDATGEAVNVGLPDLLGQSPSLELAQDVVWAFLRLVNPRAIQASDQLGDLG